MNKSEKIFSITILVFGIIGFYGASDLKYLGVGGGIGPGFFPLVLSSLIILLSIAYLISLFNKKADTEFEAESEKGSRRTRILQIWFTVTLIICVYMIPIVGMLICFTIFSFLILYILEKKSWYSSILFSLATTFLMFMIFEYFLGFSLPKGILF